MPPSLFLTKTVVNTTPDRGAAHNVATKHSALSAAITELLWLLHIAPPLQLLHDASARDALSAFLRRSDSPSRALASAALAAAARMDAHAGSDDIKLLDDASQAHEEMATLWIARTPGPDRSKLIRSLSVLDSQPTAPLPDPIAAVLENLCDGAVPQDAPLLLGWWARACSEADVTASAEDDDNDYEDLAIDVAQAFMKRLGANWPFLWQGEDSDTVDEEDDKDDPNNDPLLLAQKTVEALREAVGDPFAGALPLHIYESAFSAMRRDEYRNAIEAFTKASAVAAEALSAGTSSGTNESADSCIDPTTPQVDPLEMATAWTETLLLVVRNLGQVGRVEAEVVLALVLAEACWRIVHAVASRSGDAHHDAVWSLTTLLRLALTSMPSKISAFALSEACRRLQEEEPNTTLRAMLRSFLEERTRAPESSREALQCIAAALKLDVALTPEILWPLVNRHDSKQSDLRVSLGTYFGHQPTLLRSVAESHLARGSSDENGVLLRALSLQREPWAAELVVTHLDALLGQGLRDDVWLAIERAGDPGNLDVVLTHWCSGEVPVTETARLLAEFGGCVERLPQPLIDEEKESQAHAANLISRAFECKTPEDALRAMTDSPIQIHLRCRPCGRVHTYTVNDIIITGLPEEMGPVELAKTALLLPIPACKNCGAEEDFDLTSESAASLRAAAVLTRIAPQSEGAAVTVRLAKASLWDGTPLRSYLQGLRHLRRLAEKKNSGEAWRRFGNLSGRVGNRSDAEAAFQRALKVDPSEAEACISLAEIRWSDGDVMGAAALVRDTLTRLPKSDLSQRVITAQSLAELLPRLLEVSNDPVALTAIWNEGEVNGQGGVTASSADLRRVENWDRLSKVLANESIVSLGLTDTHPANEPLTRLEHILAGKGPIMMGPTRAGGRKGRLAEHSAPVRRSQPKVGRNQLCPCGSGKKYKRCCGLAGRASAPV